MVPANRLTPINASIDIVASLDFTTYVAERNSLSGMFLECF